MERLSIAQADSIKNTLAQSGIKTASDKEIVALIAYLQRLGKDTIEFLAMMVLRTAALKYLSFTFSSICKSSKPSVAKASSGAKSTST